MGLSEADQAIADKHTQGCGEVHSSEISTLSKKEHLEAPIAAGAWGAHVHSTTGVEGDVEADITAVEESTALKFPPSRKTNDKSWTL